MGSTPSEPQALTLPCPSPCLPLRNLGGIVSPGFSHPVTSQCKIETGPVSLPVSQWELRGQGTAFRRQRRAVGMKGSGQGATPPSDGFSSNLSPRCSFLVLFFIFSPLTTALSASSSWNQPWLCLHPHPGSAPPLPLWARALSGSGLYQ